MKKAREFPTPPLKLKAAAACLGISWRTLHDRLKVWQRRFPKVELFELDGRTKLFYPEHIQICREIRARLASERAIINRPSGYPISRDPDKSFYELLERLEGKKFVEQERRRRTRAR